MNLIKNKMVLKAGVVAMTAAVLTGCLGTSALSSGITNEGHVESSNIRFPDISEAWNKDGLYPNVANVRSIESGVSKDELYQLVGRPHFDEAKNAKEWDYTFKFKNADNSTSVCQYKVIFDSEFKGREFYWNPASCAALIEPKQSAMPIATVVRPVIEKPAPKTTKVNLSSDALFAFDKYHESDMLNQGRSDLAELAQKIVKYQQEGDVDVVVTGHTDKLGTDMYNMNLSQLRAQTVRKVLVDYGVDSSSIIAVGAGESEPVKQCSNSLTRNQQIDCLSPNRRVSISITANK